ncbi:MAG: hypothetical protein IIA53_07020 [Chloroflexi bacterium]|nr:hypothetical protein [Chloroflexota bacterium]
MSSVFFPGQCVTQGSMVGVHEGKMRHHDGSFLKDWRDAVGWSVKALLAVGSMATMAKTPR